MKFQSPSGDSLFSDKSLPLFFFGVTLALVRGGFNLLVGIRCFLTHSITISTIWLNWIVSFNPLVGIRCFLTRHFIRKR